MEWFGLLIIGVQVLFFGACFLLLVFFAIQRIEAKKTEDFEDREN